MRRALLLLLAGILALLWLVTSYLFVGASATVLAQKSVWFAEVFYLAWLIASVGYLVALRSLARKSRSRESDDAMRIGRCLALFVCGFPRGLR
jgi:hypothetical protein